MGLLDGKVAIITGAGNGIGRATARLFAREGGRIVVNDLGCDRHGVGADRTAADRVTAEIRGAGGTAIANYETVTSADGAQAMIKAAVAAYGGVDILVNCAGILRDKTLLKTTEEMWHAVLAVHLTGTFLCTQAAAAQMKSHGGRIVNTVSVSGMLGNFSQANTAAATAGVYGLTRTAAIELQRYGITVNAVSPIAKTRMTADLPMFERLESLTPEHVAPVYLFLASDLCGDRTGHVLAVAGGKISSYKVSESSGLFKEGAEGVWKADEIADHWDALVKG